MILAIRHRSFPKSALKFLRNIWSLLEHSATKTVGTKGSTLSPSTLRRDELGAQTPGGWFKKQGDKKTLSNNVFN